MQRFACERIQDTFVLKLKKEIFRQVLGSGNYRLFFFGSRVKGNNFPRSDIDLGVEGKNKLPSSLKLELEEKLQNLPILYKIDLVDFNDVGGDFKKRSS